MSDRLFKRSWKLIVDDVDVSALDIEFQVLRTLKSEPNRASIVVWNLGPENRAKLEKRNRPENKKTKPVQVYLEAGYVGNVMAIFNGDMREIVSVREGSDWKTTITAEDGGVSWREAAVSACFKAGTTIESVVKYIAGQMGVGLGNLSKEIAGASAGTLGATLEHPITLSGSAAKAMNRLMTSTGLTWSIQGGSLQILKPGEPVGQTAILLTDKTGLLGSPASAVVASSPTGSQSIKFGLNVKLDKKSGLSIGGQAKARKTQKVDPSIIKLKCLLIPGMLPGKKIDLRSDLFNGGYVATECAYKGQSWSSEWGIDVTARIY